MGLVQPGEVREIGGAIKGRVQLTYSTWVKFEIPETSIVMTPRY